MTYSNSVSSWRALVDGVREFARVLFFWITDQLAVALPRQVRAGGVVVVRMDAIGDFVLWLDCARQMREKFAGRKITLVANSIWADLARELPYWDEVWPVRVKNFASMRRPRERWRLLRAIRQRGFEVAIGPCFSRNMLVGDSVIRATGAPERVGSSGDLSNMDARWKDVADRWYTRLLPANAAALTELERSAEFMRAFGFSQYVAVIPRMPPMNLASEFLKKFSALPRPYFIVFPGASHNGRCWPAENFYELLMILRASTGWTPILCGGIEDVVHCQVIFRKSEGSVINLAGMTSLPEFAEIVRGARLLVGNETSAVHIAAASGTRSICILGGGHFGRFLPYPSDLPGTAPVVVNQRMPCYGCNWRCTEPHMPDAAFPCIAAVSVSSVAEIALRELGNTRTGRLDG